MLRLGFEYAKRVCWIWNDSPRKSEPGFESSLVCPLANNCIASLRYVDWPSAESVIRLVLYVGPNRA